MENEFIIDNYFDESYKIDKIQTDNGVGYIVTRGNGAVIIPPNFQETDTIAFMVCGQSVDQNRNYLPGNGSAFYGTSPFGPQLIKKAKDVNNPEFPPYAVVISNDDLYISNDALYKRKSGGLGLTVYERGTGLLEDTYNAITKGGAEIKNIGGTMFSNGGYGGLLAMDEFLSKHPDERFNTRIVLNDAYNVEKIFKQKGNQYDRTELNDELTFLKANNAEIVTLYRTKNPNSYVDQDQIMNAVALAALGFNSVTIESSAEKHQVSPFFDICGWNYFKNGIFNLVGANGTPRYLYINNKLSYDNNVDLRSIGLLSYDSTLVSSNSDYVIKVMNDIRTKIRQSSFLDFENIKKILL